MMQAREIDRDTVEDMMRLSVAPDQRRFVAPNAVTIAQAHYEPAAWLRGLWHGTTPVGLIAMIDMRPDHPDAAEEDPDNAAYLWRLMIAAEHQGKGFGGQAIEIAFAQARHWGRETLCLHVVEADDSPLAFYRRFGLEPTERIDDGERLLVGPVRAKA